VDDAFELSLIENTQRDNLTPLEEAEGLSDLMRRQGYTQKEAGEKIGRDPTQASRLVKLSKLPKAIKAKVATSQLSRDQLFQIASQKNEEAMDQLLKEITERKLNVRETRERANIKPTKKSKTTPALQKLRSSHTFLNKSENTFTGLNSQEKEKALAYLKDIIESSKRVIEHLNKTT
jgi:ParB family chromosome partitioning protein